MTPQHPKDPRAPGDSAAELSEAKRAQSITDIVKYVIYFDGSTRCQFSAVDGDLMRCRIHKEKHPERPLDEGVAYFTERALSAVARRILQTAATLTSRYPELSDIVPQHLGIPDAAYFPRQGDVGKMFADRIVPAIRAHFDKWGRSPDAPPTATISDSGALQIGNLCLEYVGEQRQTTRRVVSAPESSRVYGVSSKEGRNLIEAPFYVWAELAAHIAKDSNIMEPHWLDALSGIRTRPADAFSGRQIRESVTISKPDPNDLDQASKTPAPELRVLGNLRWFIERAVELTEGKSLPVSVAAFQPAVRAMLAQVESRIGSDFEATPPSDLEIRKAEILPKLEERRRRVKGSLERIISDRVDQLGALEGSIQARRQAVDERVIADRVTRLVSGKAEQERAAAGLAEREESAKRELASAQRLKALIDTERQGAEAALELDREALAVKRDEVRNRLRTLAPELGRLQTKDPAAFSALSKLFASSPVKPEKGGPVVLGPVVTDAQPVASPLGIQGASPTKITSAAPTGTPTGTGEATGERAGPERSLPSATGAPIGPQPSPKPQPKSGRQTAQELIREVLSAAPEESRESVLAKCISLGEDQILDVAVRCSEIVDAVKGADPTQDGTKIFGFGVSMLFDSPANFRVYLQLLTSVVKEVKRSTDKGGPKAAIALSNTLNARAKRYAGSGGLIEIANELEI